MQAKQLPPSSAHLHAHHDGDATHAHFNVQRSRLTLAWALGLTLCFAVVEVLAGMAPVVQSMHTRSFRTRLVRRITAIMMPATIAAFRCNTSTAGIARAMRTR